MPNRISYEEELLRQHQRPPPPTGPAPSLLNAESAPFYPSVDRHYAMHPHHGSYQGKFQQHHLNAVNRQKLQFGHGNQKYQQQQQLQQLPEHERCTLRCTGIPPHVKESDIRAHFNGFGPIVELQVSAMPEHAMSKSQQVQQQQQEAEEEEKKSAEASSSALNSAEETAASRKKVYQECLVQFYSATVAKKCLNSPLPVLNNRFIHVYHSPFNIIPPKDVPRAPEPPPVLSKTSAEEPSSGKTHSGLNIFQQGVSNKWKRPTNSNEASDAPSKSETIASEQPGSEGKTEAMNAEAPPANSKVHAQREAVKETYAKLKTLAEQNLELLKKKEAAIMVSVLILFVGIEYLMFDLLNLVSDGEISRHDREARSHHELHAKHKHHPEQS